MRARPQRRPPTHLIAQQPLPRLLHLLRARQRLLPLRPEPRRQVRQVPLPAHQTPPRARPMQPTARRPPPGLLRPPLRRQALPRRKPERHRPAQRMQLPAHRLPAPALPTRPPVRLLPRPQRLAQSRLGIPPWLRLPTSTISTWDRSLPTRRPITLAELLPPATCTTTPTQWPPVEA